ncbi:MAG: 2-amino-4-oxopentanoate thiolase subunit OrtA [Peptoniphilus sp.]|nr:2-amino-4-oxopentanoate thiolase subunit OrtA [Peptoniphilus sp.]MDD7363583.1 2-amino-4-oxopentanoate thiolase subunit OrtA [Bacillota bacterium]MDY6045226.1 2-amino-4-oxopentanoate thiolase subunit OrtA [Peptoniphilus sp.]
MSKIQKGTWVQITKVVLPAGKRAPQVPEDTQQHELRMWVKGFLNHDADVREEVEITTVTGRKVSGELFAVEPKYTHTYGDFVPELLKVQCQLRDILFGGESDE